MNNDAAQERRLLAHKRAVDNQRRAQAILKAQHQRRINAERMARVMRAAVNGEEAS